MAQNDMYVVMYKILAYLYDCMKRGVRPSQRHYAHDGDVLSIPYSYWAAIMHELANHGYVSGVTVFEDMGGDLIVSDIDPMITMEGVEFLQENSTMKKALRFLQDTKSALPFI